MADASYLQTNFLGGEWSPYQQGRADDPRYKSAMARCLNMIPVEEGAATKRPGTRLVGPTRRGEPAILREFHFSEAASYQMVLSEGHLRFTNGPAMALDGISREIVDISSATPAVITTADQHGWTTDDDIVIVTTPGNTFTNGAILFGRQWTITVLDDYTFNMTDAITGEIFDGATYSGANPHLRAERVLDFATPYYGERWRDVNTTQSSTEVLLLQADTPVQVVSSTTPQSPAGYAAFTIAPAEFQDGPYMDPPEDGTTITPSDVTGDITLVASGNIFQPSDVGRMVRLLSEPAVWSDVTAYATGDVVKFGDVYWSALDASTGVEPDLDVAKWVTQPQGANWTWGRITDVIDQATVSFTIEGDDMLYSRVVSTYRLGLYSQTTGYPTCGTYHEGRFWLSGVIPNRFDGSVSNEGFNFSPTGPDGTVADDNAIAALIKATDVNTIFWLHPDQQGIILGTQGGEWLVQASSLNDPLTPTSIQAHRVTKFGCANVPPVKVPLAVLFVDRFDREFIEYVPDAAAGKYTGSNLIAAAKHLAKTGIKEVCYQHEAVPIVWARMGDGSLAGATYQHESPTQGTATQFAAWHRHELGSGRVVESIQAGPSVGGDIDSVSLITNDLGTDVRFIELLTPVFGEDDAIERAWFCDSALLPVVGDVIAGTPRKVRLYGLSAAEGQEVSVFATGLDLGQFTVTDGAIEIPLVAPFDEARLAAMTVDPSTFDGLGVVVNQLGGAAVPTPAGATILGYDEPATGITSFNSGLVIPDWNNARFLVMATGSDAAAGFIRYDLDSVNATGQASATSMDLAAKGVTEDNVNEPAILGTDGYLYWYAGGGGRGTLRKLNIDTMQLEGTFGAYSVGNDTDGSALAKPYNLVGVKANANYVVAARTYTPAEAAEIAVVNVDSMTLQGVAFQITGTETALLAPGPMIGPNAGSCFILTAVYNDFGQIVGSAGQPLRLYQLKIDADGEITNTLLGTITPHQIDATWTHITRLGGMMYDESDGNVMFQTSITAPATTLDWSNAITYDQYSVVFGTNDHAYQSIAGGNLNHDPVSDAGVHWTDLGSTTSYTHESYLVKLDTSDASVKWATSINHDVGSTEDYCFMMNRCRFGRLAQLSPSTNGSTGGLTTYPFYVFNTYDGTVNTISLRQTSAWSGQAYDDTSGYLLVDCNYAKPGAFAPQPIPPTGDTITSGWAALPVVASDAYIAPFTVGYSFTAQGQLLRPITDGGAQNGPGFAKTRRAHQFGALLHKSQKVSFGTVFDRLRPAEFKSPGGTTYALTALYSGIVWSTIEDDYSFDSQICWEATRPYPLTVLAIGWFGHTQDR